MGVQNLTAERQEMGSLKMVRATLAKFDRAKILQVYFSRLDGRLPETLDVECNELYEIPLQDIKAYLLGQHPHDSILQRIFRIMN